VKTINRQSILLLILLIAFFVTGCDTGGTDIPEDNDTDIRDSYTTMSLDETFGETGLASPGQWTHVPAKTDSSIEAIEYTNIATDSQGNIYVLGEYEYKYNSSDTKNTVDIMVAKYDSDGNLDTSFGNYDSTGGGAFFYYAYDYYWDLNSNNTWDGTGTDGYWADSSLSTFRSSSIAVDSQDRVYVAFSSRYTEPSWSGYNTDAFLIRLTQNGELDTEFDTDGREYYSASTEGYDYTVEGILLDGDTPIIYGGLSSTSPKAFAMKYDATVEELVSLISQDFDSSNDVDKPSFSCATVSDDAIFLGNVDNGYVEAYSKTGSELDTDTLSLPYTGEDPLGIAFSGNGLYTGESDLLALYSRVYSSETGWSDTLNISMWDVTDPENPATYTSFNNDDDVTTEENYIQIDAYEIAALTFEADSLLVIGTTESDSNTYAHIWKYGLNGEPVTEFGTAGSVAIDDYQFIPKGYIDTGAALILTGLEYRNNTGYQAGIMKIDFSE